MTQQSWWNRCFLCGPYWGVISRINLEFSYLWDSRRPIRKWIQKMRDLWHWKPLPDKDWWKHSRLRRFSACCSELRRETERECLYIYIYILAIELQLLVVTIFKCSINPISNPYPVYSHSTMWQYRIYSLVFYISQKHSCQYFPFAQWRYGTIEEYRKPENILMMMWQTDYNQSFRLCSLTLWRMDPLLGGDSVNNSLCDIMPATYTPIEQRCYATRL
jgi:hypothetical protein